MGASRGGLAADRDRAYSAAGSPSGAVERIDALCRLTVAGKLAARDLSAWVSNLGVSEAEFRLMWLLFRGSAGAGCRGDSDAASETPHAVNSFALDQGALAERLAVSAAQISGAVARLQSRQLIVPLRDGSDRRRQLWRLAEAGDALVNDVLATVAGRDNLARPSPRLAAPFEGGSMKEAAA